MNLLNLAPLYITKNETLSEESKQIIRTTIKDQALQVYTERDPTDYTFMNNDTRKILNEAIKDIATKPDANETQVKQLLHVQLD